MAMSREQMVDIATRHRDAWAEELRYRLIGAIYDDVTDYSDWGDDALEDSTDEEWHAICQMMEESISLKLNKVEDIL